jgi:hypothetical protein
MLSVGWVSGIVGASLLALRAAARRALRGIFLPSTVY